MDTMQISKEWASRPDDQRFLSLDDLHEFNVNKRALAQEFGAALEHTSVRATDDGRMLLIDSGAGKFAGELNNWAFGQLAQRAGAPAGYLRSLPAQLAQIPLQWSLEQAGQQDAKVLIRGTSVQAVTSEAYGRIFDSELSGAMANYLDPTVWKVPAASYASSDPKKATTLYASDRDMFVCLVDDSNAIEVPGMGNERLHRGIIARNSEVGAATLEIICFMYRFICDNRIIWGGQEVQSLKIRHTSGGPARYLRQAQPLLQRYLESSTNEAVGLVRSANQTEVGRTEPDVRAWLKARGFTGAETTRAIDLAEKDPGGANPRSVWGLVQGLTAAAQEKRHGDERLELERRAAKLLDRVAIDADFRSVSA